MPLQLQYKNYAQKDSPSSSPLKKKNLVNRDYKDDNEVFSISNPRFCTRTLEKGNHQIDSYFLM